MRDDLQAWLTEQAAALGLAVDDPAAIARRLGELLRAKVPERVSKGYWLTVDGRSDNGFDVRLWEVKPTWMRGHALKAAALLGAWSGGVGVECEVFAHAISVSETGASRPVSVRAWVGIGAVVPYSDLRGVTPAAVVSISIRA